MSDLTDRAKAQENQYAHNEELRFKAMARRNKLLGLWAAKEMGLKSDQLDAYVKSVVVSDFEEPGDEDVLRKEMDILMEEAIRQMQAE